MARKPISTHTTTNFKVKAKKLRKKDRVFLFGYCTLVTSNNSNDYHERVLELETAYGPRRNFKVIIGDNVKVNVSKHEHTNHPENR